MKERKSKKEDSYIKKKLHETEFFFTSGKEILL